MQHELHVLALIKGSEHYVYVFDDQSNDGLLNLIRDQAANPELALSWFDAAILTDRLKSAQPVSAPPIARPKGISLDTN